MASRPNSALDRYAAAAPPHNLFPIANALRNSGALPCLVSLFLLSHLTSFSPSVTHCCVFVCTAHIYSTVEEADQNPLALQYRQSTHYSQVIEQLSLARDPSVSGIQGKACYATPFYYQVWTLHRCAIRDAHFPAQGDIGALVTVTVTITLLLTVILASRDRTGWWKRTAAFHQRLILWAVKSRCIHPVLQELS